MPKATQGSGLDQIQAIIEREGMLVRRQVLEEEHARLLAQVASVERRLAELGGERHRPRAAVNPKARRGPGRPPSAVGRPAGGGLRDFVAKALEASGKSLTTAELAEKVIQVGFVTKAKPTNLRIMLVKALKDKTRFRKVKRGLYALKQQQTEA